MITVEKTTLEGVLLIKPETFEDFRGTYTETYNKHLYTENGIDLEFVQDDYSTSSRGTLRGLHGDQNTWKLISCMLGSFYFVVLNYDQESSQFGMWEGFTLSEANRWQVLVPPNFGNGHLAMSDKIIFNYKQTSYYNANTQFSIKYNDPRFNIWWPIDNPLLSRRDQNGGLVKL